MQLVVIGWFGGGAVAQLHNGEYECYGAGKISVWRSRFNGALIPLIFFVTENDEFEKYCENQ